METTAGDLAVAIIGGGVCGVMAGARCIRERINFVILERGTAFGGNWIVRANSYSHLQAHAALYQWDKDFVLDKNPFRKVPAKRVLDTIHKYAQHHKLKDHTRFSTEVCNVRRAANNRFTIYCKHVNTGHLSTLDVASIFIASGILGEQCSPIVRQLPSLDAFTGEVAYASRHQGEECMLGQQDRVKDKDVVILGTGAFALEAMEAAHRAHARSITLITRARDRWIVPYSRQFKFVFLATNPLCPRWLACRAINTWMQALYAKCGIAFMGPAAGSEHNFTGQCNDAFFQLAHQGKVRYIASRILGFRSRAISLGSGDVLPADIIVNALGCEINWQPSYLKELDVGFKADLHNFAFLGKTARIGTASDWVWYNVPHGPQKQIESFFHGQRCIRDGKEQEFVQALEPTPFSGCKGESLVASNPSGLLERSKAYRRSLTAGRSSWGRWVVVVGIELQEVGTWLLCAVMYAVESVALNSWLQHH